MYPIMRGDGVKSQDLMAQTCRGISCQCHEIFVEITDGSPVDEVRFMAHPGHGSRRIGSRQHLLLCPIQHRLLGRAEFQE